jgi:hypothetical protein
MVASGVVAGTTRQVQWNSGTGFGADGNFTYPSTGVVSFLNIAPVGNVFTAGPTNANPPTAQTWQMNSAVAGGSAGANWTYIGSLSSNVNLPGNINFCTGIQGPPPQTAVTITNGTPSTFSANRHGFYAGLTLLFTGTPLPTGISPLTPYWVINDGLTTNQFQISSTFFGSGLTTTGASSGVQAIPGSTITFIDTTNFAIAGPAQHSLAQNTIIQFQSTGALPTGLLPNTNYYMIINTTFQVLHGGNFQVSLTPNGPVVPITGVGSGTITYTVQQGINNANLTYPSIALGPSGAVGYENTPGIQFNHSWNTQGVFNAGPAFLFNIQNNALGVFAADGELFKISMSSYPVLTLYDNSFSGGGSSLVLHQMNSQSNASSIGVLQNGDANLRVGMTLDRTASNRGFLGMQTPATTGGIEYLSFLISGSGYVPGYYQGVPVTGGTGSGAQLNILVNSAGQVQNPYIYASGGGYVYGDILSASNANLGGSGSGFQITVTSIAGAGGPNPSINGGIGLYQDSDLLGAGALAICRNPSQVGTPNTSTTRINIFGTINGANRGNSAGFGNNEYITLGWNQSVGGAGSFATIGTRGSDIIGGSHPPRDLAVIFTNNLGGSASTVEVVRFVAASNQVQFTNAANFSANGAVATVLGSIGPTGSHTTVQTWLTILDNSSTVRYIPCF